MKRLLLVVTILISLALVLVSCNVEVPVAGDKLCLVKIGDNTKALNASASSSKFVYNLFWYYTAQYVGSSVYRTGETTELTPVRGSKSSPEKGFAGSSLGYFSTGRWSFSLWGFNTPSESADPSNAVFYQEGINIDLSNDQHYITAVLRSGSGNNNARLTFNNVCFVNDSAFQKAFVLKVYEETDESVTLLIKTEEVIADASETAYFTISSGYENVTLTDGEHSLVFVVYDTETDKAIGRSNLVVNAVSGTVITVSDIIIPAASESISPYSIDTSDWRFAFGLEYTDSNKNWATGIQSYTDETEFTYKFIIDDPDNTARKIVVEGETVKEKNTLYYWLHVPYNYDSSKTYPIITFIHGSGACIYYQDGSEGHINPTVSSVFDDPDGSSWKRLLAGNNQYVYSILNEQSQFKSGKSVGEDSNKFIKAWFDYVNLHPEADCFFIVPNLTDEMWFENRTTYKLYLDTDSQKYKVFYNNDFKNKDTDGIDFIENAQMLDISHAYLAGADYGTKYNSQKYNLSYNSEKVGENVWFQLLTKLEDYIADKYMAGKTVKRYVVGASLGGVAVFDLLVHNPTRYTGAVAFGAPGSDEKSDNIDDITTKVLALHNFGDEYVPDGSSIRFINKLNPSLGVYKSYGNPDVHPHWPPSVFKDKFDYIFSNYLYGQPGVEW